MIATIASAAWRIFGAIARPLALALLATVVVLTIQRGAARHEAAENAKARDGWQRTAGQYLASATAWKAHWTAEHRNRDAEATQAEEDAKALTLSCTARIAAARRSSDLIGKLLETPANATPNACPDSQRLLDPDSLRNAIGAGSVTTR
jgi:hypothetical protein